MIQTFDTLGQFEKPDITLCNPNRIELYSLNTARNLKHTVRFNAVSEFTFTIEQYVDDTLIPAYEHVISKKLVYIKDVGYFVISEVTENTDGKIPYKEAICYSQEIELSFKKIAITGTKKFYNAIPVPGTTTLMDIIIGYLPSWSVGTIHPDLWGLYRTFDLADNNIYNFLMTDVETAYGCIFTFDTINKTISATTIDTSTNPTDIYLSYDNLLQDAGLKEIASEVCTKLYVYGSNGLGITSVNPLGGSAIYSFEYYKNLNWMTQSLIGAIDDWETLVTTNQGTYSTYLLQLIALNTTLITKNGEMDALETSLSEQEVLLQAAVEAGTSLTAIYDEMNTINGNIATKNAEIAIVQDNIIYKTADITAIVNLLSFDTNFTALEKEELDSFIFENTYQNASLTVTDIMTPNERQAVAQQLYDEATTLVMPKVSVPRYEFTANTTNFVLLPEFSSFTGEVEMGCTVTINVRDTYTITPALLEMVITYDNPSDFSMTFSNRLRLDNAGFIFTDIVGNNNNVSTAVGFNSAQWGNWEAEYKYEVTTFISSAVDASVNMLMSSDDEEITISNVGLRGQRLLSPGVYSDKKVWLTSNLLAFTDDNWQTAKLALGEINLPGGGTAYGLAAEVIVGTLLAGTQLLITNSSNPLTSTFSVDASGATLINSTLTVTSTSTNARLLIDPLNTNIFRIQKKVASVYTDVLYADTNGDVTMKGILSVETATPLTKIIIDGSSSIPFRIQKWITPFFYDKFWVDAFGNVNFDGALVGATGSFSGSLSAATGTFSGDISGASGTFSGDITASGGTIGGITIETWGLSFPGGNYIGFDGTMVLGNLTVTATTATFNGTLSATTIVGTNNAQTGALINWPGGISIGEFSSGFAYIKADNGVRIQKTGEHYIEISSGYIFLTTTTVGGVARLLLNDSGDADLNGANQVYLRSANNIILSSDILSRKKDESDEGYGVTVIINPNSYNNFKFINGILVDYY